MTGKASVISGLMDLAAFLAQSCIDEEAPA